MPWRRMKFKKGKVWVHVDREDKPILVDGSAEFRYKLDDNRTYNTATKYLEPLGGSSVKAPKSEAPVESRATAKRDAPPLDNSCGSITVYTDGACSGNPGPGGLGVVMIWGEHRKEFASYLGPKSTNNIAELSAIYYALKQIKNRAIPIEIHTDSSYSLGLLAKGWKAKANAELVADIRDLMGKFAKISFIKVAGHAGIPENERADVLARMAVERRIDGEVKEN